MIRGDDHPEYPIAHGLDTDGDGHPDTLPLPDPVELTVLVDTDRDGLADLLLRVGPDGIPHTTDLAADPDPWWPVDPAAGTGGDPFGPG